MDILRSPWRYDYVSTASDPRPCVLCVDSGGVQDAAVGSSPPSDEASLVLYRGPRTFVIMNLYPYTSGHLMVVPYRHIGTMTELEVDELREMMVLAQRSTEVLENSYRPEGFNIGMNIGHCAGAGVRHHLHLHVVPRWCGDVNFMTTTGETRVLPEDVHDGYRRLRPLFSSLAPL